MYEIEGIRIVSSRAVFSFFSDGTSVALDGQPEASIVIDAMVGSQQRLIDRADEDAYQNICNMIRWSHRQTAPILSIDFPTGVDGGTGQCVAG